MIMLTLQTQLQTQLQGNPSSTSKAESELSEDPFAMLGSKQESMSHPHLEAIQQDEARQREIDALRNNQFTPSAMLPSKHFVPRHSSSRLNVNPNAHSRSRTQQVPPMNRAQTFAPDDSGSLRFTGAPRKRPSKRMTAVILMYMYLRSVFDFRFGN